MSLAMNPRGMLYRNAALIEITAAPAIQTYQAKLASQPWATYPVRRIYSGPGKADRAVEKLAIFSRVMPRRQSELRRIQEEVASSLAFANTVVDHQKT